MRRTKSDIPVAKFFISVGCDALGVSGGQDYGQEDSCRAKMEGSQ